MVLHNTDRNWKIIGLFYAIATCILDCKISMILILIILDSKYDIYMIYCRPIQITTELILYNFI